MVSGARLLRALARSAAAYGCAPELSLAGERDWASALFVGARYDVAAELAAGAAAGRWIADLPVVDLPMPRQFASDVRVLSRRDGAGRIALVIEVLVLAD